MAVTKLQEPAAVDRVKPRALRDDVVAAVEEGILTGVFRPGQRLVERELVARYRVSSIPVREALQELEKRGLVVRRHNHGCTVVQLSPSQVDDACAVRRLLEPVVARWAAQRLTIEAGAELSDQLQRLQAAAEAGDLATYLRQDLRLHRALWAAAGNEFAVRALEATVGSLFASSLARPPQDGPRDLRAEAATRAALVGAVLSGRDELAATLMAEIAEASAALNASARAAGHN